MLLSSLRLKWLRNFRPDNSVIQSIDATTFRISIVYDLIEGVNLQFLVWIDQSGRHVFFRNEIAFKILGINTSLVQINWRGAKYVLTLIDGAENSQIDWI